MQELLGIDLGSNTLRAVLMDTNGTILRESEYIIGAAEGLDESGFIGKEAQNRLIQALDDMKQRGFELKNANAGATAAFRKAKNTKEIFQILKEKFDIHFRLLSEEDEARLSRLGMQHSLRLLGLYQGNLAYCDLGGASCEISFNDKCQSFDFGIISFYERAKNFSLNAKRYTNLQISKQKTRDKKLKLSLLLKDKKLLKQAFAAFIQSQEARKFLSSFKGKKVVLNSGVPTALIALKKQIPYQNYDASLVNGSRLCQDDFLHYALKLHCMSEEEASFFVGKKRKNYLIAGCFLLYALFEKCKFIVVDSGLREGLCLEKIP